jgi:hypothetical protein
MRIGIKTTLQQTMLCENRVAAIKAEVLLALHANRPTNQPSYCASLTDQKHMKFFVTS